MEDITKNEELGTEEVPVAPVTPEPVEVPEAPIAPEAPIVPQTELAEGKSENGAMGGALGAVAELLKKVSKKVWAIIGGAVALLIVVIILISSLSNTYKTPVKIMQKQANRKSYVSATDSALENMNGFAKGELKHMLKLLEKSDFYKDDLDDAKEDFKDSIEGMKAEYGKNYKYTYKIVEKEALERADLRAFRDQLRQLYYKIEALEDQTEDYDSDEWEDMADEYGLTKSRMKKLVKATEEFGEECKSAKVSKGYELTVLVTLTGSEMESPEEYEMTLRVYKVDGRWISANALYFPVF